MPWMPDEGSMNLTLVSRWVFTAKQYKQLNRRNDSTSQDVFVAAMGMMMGCTKHISKSDTNSQDAEGQFMTFGPLWVFGNNNRCMGCMSGMMKYNSLSSRSGIVDLMHQGLCSPLKAK